MYTKQKHPSNFAKRPHFSLSIRQKFRNTPFLLAYFLMLSSLILGGTSQQGVFSNTVLYSLAIIILFAIIPAFLAENWNSATYFSLACVCILLLVFLLQLVPVPREIWLQLPARNTLLEAGKLFPEMNFSHTLTISTKLTTQSLFSLIPPISIFLCTLLCNYRERSYLVYLFVYFAFFSALLGFAQVADGPDSVLRFYTFTNNQNGVGFFSNRNHFSALLYSAIPFVFISLLNKRDTTIRRRERQSVVKNAMANTYLHFYFLLFIFIVLCLGIALSNSRAGIGLAVLAMFISTIIVVILTNKADRLNVVLLIGMVLFVAVSIAVFYSYIEVYYKLTEVEFWGLRSEFNKTTRIAAEYFFPFGSGAGTFELAYKMFEERINISPQIVNRAHNDILEWILELGASAFFIFMLAILWYILAIVRVYRMRYHTIAEISRRHSIAAAIIPILILCHSLFDYPLRTASISVLVAFCCALTIPPRVRNFD